MATRNTLFKVDLGKENPLKTILDNGKIPCVRFGTTGFQNYKQKGYFERHNFDYNGERGCFVHIGGVHGTYVCGGHFGETLNIGYIEPNEIIFCPYSSNTKKVAYLTTAKERFEEAKANYEEKDKLNFDSDDLDLFSEAIVDSKKIKKVCEIPCSQYGLLLKYTDYDDISILNSLDLFHSMITTRCISEEFWNHIDIHFNSTLDVIFEVLSFYELLHNKIYKEIILEEFQYWIDTNTFLHTDEFFKTFNAKLKEMIAKTQKLNLNLVFFNELFDEEWKIDYNLKGFKRKFDRIIVRSNGEITAYNDIYDWKNKKHEYKITEITEDNILDYRFDLKPFIEIHETINSLFKDYFIMSKPHWYMSLKTFIKMEEEFIDWNLNYKYDNKYKELTFTTDSFSFVYNLKLFDGVVEIFNDEENHFYNLENIPNDFSRTWLDIILKLLSKWKQL